MTTSHSEESVQLALQPPGALVEEVQAEPPKEKHVVIEAATASLPSPRIPGVPSDTPPTARTDVEASPVTHHKTYFGIGDWLSTFTQHSETTQVGDLYPRVSWQWEHKTGWRDYNRKVSTKIEISYRRGETKTRVQTGKKGAVPMEIFFEDMLQHDPVTGNTRNVQRCGPWSRWQKTKRFLGGVTRALETGRPRKERFADYQKRRQEHVLEIEQHEDIDDEVFHGRHCCGLVASSPLFATWSMLMVIAYAVWLGVDADYNTSLSLVNAKPVFQVVENVFCVLFMLELIIRFCGFEERRKCIRDPWFLFDLVLILLMIAELWVMPLIFIFAPDLSNNMHQFATLRTLRLARLARLTSLLKAFPEAMMLLKGCYQAVRGVVTTFCLLVVMLFIFGLIFKSQAMGKDTGMKYFSSLWQSMVCLLMYATLLDGPAQVYFEIEEDLGELMALLFLLFIFISAFTVMNMLIGILCEVVNKVSETEKEEAQIRWLKRHLQDILECYDANQDKHIGVKEFDLLLANLEFREILMSFGTDIQTFGDIVKAEYSNHLSSISFASLVTHVLRLKGGNGAQVADIAELRKCVKQLEDRLEKTGLLEDRAVRPPSVESIKVRILRARGFRCADQFPMTGLSDVYCRCVVLGKPRSGVRTRVVKDSQSPEWDEEFVMADYQAGEHLRFQLFDQDLPFVKEDDYLGSVVLESNRFCPQGFEGELRLTGGGKGVEAYLEVKVTVKLLPDSEQEAQRPKTSDSMASASSNDSGGTSTLATILARLDDVYAGQKALDDNLQRIQERLDIVEVAVTRTCTPDLRGFT